jgi:hypothetical protein
MMPSRPEIDWRLSAMELRDGIRVRGWWVMLEACLRHGRTQEKNHTGAQARSRIRDKEAPV